MSEKALRETLDQAVERIVKKLDRKTLVEGFDEVRRQHVTDLQGLSDVVVY